MTFVIKPKKHTTAEIKRAIIFLVSQMNRGYSAREAMNQVETSYGEHIAKCVIYHIKKWNKESI